MNLYTFVIPFSGTMSVWTDAETEEERIKVINEKAGEHLKDWLERLETEEEKWENKNS